MGAPEGGREEEEEEEEEEGDEEETAAAEAEEEEEEEEEGEEDEDAPVSDGCFWSEGDAAPLPATEFRRTLTCFTTPCTRISYASPLAGSAPSAVAAGCAGGGSEAASSRSMRA